jgi:hypothetical protein
MAIPSIIFKPFKNKSLNLTKIINDILIVIFCYLNSLYYDYYYLNITLVPLNSNITAEETILIIRNL